MEEEKKSLKEKILIILRDRIFLTLFLAGFFLNVLFLVLVKFLINFDQPVLILHYNVFFGIDRIGLGSDRSSFQLFFVLLEGFLIWFANFSLAFFLYLTSIKEQLEFIGSGKNKKKKINSQKITRSKIFGSYLLLGASIIVSLEIGIYAISIILVNN